MMEPDQAPALFQAYSWDGKHKLYGYPPDRFPEFEWIANLERRFLWLQNAHETEKTAAIYLLMEMIQWGGSQNGTLQKFEDGIAEVKLIELVHDTITSLGDPAMAIRTALKIPGFGLTYASKLLQFLDPKKYGALDSRIRGKLGSELPTIHDSQVGSMVGGFVAFTRLIDEFKITLKAQKVARPLSNLGSADDIGWRAADIEMALFQWSSK